MDLIHHIDIETDREKIYRAIATQEGLRGWWTADTQAEEREGGKATFGFSKRSMVFRMEIVKLEPNKRVVWNCLGDHPEWEGTRLEWEIDKGMETENGLWFRHKNWKENTILSASCNSTWGDLMWILRDYAEGKNPGPKWTE